MFLICQSENASVTFQSLVSCFFLLLLLNYSGVKNCDVQNDKINISVCKANRICVVGKKKGIKMELFFLRKNDDNNFILQLFVSG